ncbi:hypothetical protein AB1339_13915 [Streptomyces cyaneofuscatus]|uniref:hypothetical protein n=1 Tax=Streptomyces cyaneofuscatus TaxID=66883 RepID=UPI00345C8F14
MDFAPLRGEAAGADASEAARRCLRSLGVDDTYIPGSFADRVRLLRSLTADRRLLIFLDNVSGPGQAAALIPKGKGSFLVVAGGSGLGELALDGARLMVVEPLDRDSALELLADRCGAEKVAADPASAERLVELCAGLPVALHVVAGRLVARPRLTLAALAAELAAEPRRLAGMSLGKERSAAAAFDLVYRELAPEPARLYRLMGWHPGATFDAGVAAVAAGLDPRRTAEALEALTGASLLEETPDGRFRFHDLVRLHAGDRATEEEGPAERPALLRRVTLHYLALNALADRAIRDCPGGDPRARLLGLGKETLLRGSGHRLGRAQQVVERGTESGQRLPRLVEGALGDGGEALRPLRGEGGHDLFAYITVDVEAGGRPSERGHRRAGDGLAPVGTQQDRFAERRTVQSHRPVVAHDHIRRDQGRPPRVDMGDEHQPVVQRGRQKIADLPGTVPRPDIGMGDGRDPELVVRQRGEHPGRQPRVLTDQRRRPPRRAEHHQPVPVGHAERPAVGGCPVRAAQQFVVARVAHQQGAPGRLRMGGEQLLLLPRVRDGQPGPAGLQQAVRHDPRQPVTGRTGVRHLLLEADAVG